MAIAAIGDQGRATARGARSAGVSYQDLLASDTRETPALLRTESPMPPGVTKVPAEQYLSRAFHRLEVEKVWKRVWQMACREEDIPEVGDYIVYDIAQLSFLVVRVAEHEIRAYHNACLHRGRQLREWDGKRAQEFRCPFHGWTWDITGDLKEVVCPWDFPDVTAEEYALPQVRVGRWGGFVFINPDQECGSFEDFIGDLPAHFERWDLSQRYKQAHVAKYLRCNWKVAQEAFMEAYHVVATHPQILASIGDSNSQYDVFGNFSRAISPNATPSPHLKARPDEQAIINALFDLQFGDTPPIIIPEGKTAREIAAHASREGMRGLIGDAADSFSDAEYMDSFYYTLFPNFHPWGAFNRITYRFRPNGDDPDTCIMECMLLAPLPPGDRPPSAAIHWLEFDDDWTRAPELGMLARIFNQDVFNIPKVQIGLKAMKQPEVVFASYNETKIRHFHELLDLWVAAE
ncbi:iron-sulfur protein [bacterium SCGC AG-212-C10]|nr:iron-sulfur protein [bacterium SCGC AG-212-C10]